MKKLAPSVILALVILGIQFLMSLFSLALGGIDEDTNIALKIVLGVIFLLGVVVMIYAYVRNTSYREFNRRQNNLTRAKNSEPVTDKMRGQEYRWFKGYAIGVALSIPLIVFASLAFRFPSVGIVSFLLYGCYLLPIYLVFGSYSIGLQYIAILFVVLIPGLSYHLQGIKMQKGMAKRNDSRIKR